jgi:hypothetical protein
MKSWGGLCAAVVMGLAIYACAKPNPTVEALRGQVEQYEKDLSAETSAKVSSTLDTFDSELNALRTRADAASGSERDDLEGQVRSLEEIRSELRGRYLTARVRAAAASAKTVARDASRAVGDAVGEGLRRAGDALKDAADSVGTGGSTGAAAGTGRTNEESKSK